MQQEEDQERPGCFNSADFTRAARSQVDMGQPRSAAAAG
jgi:hypothetical protein